MSWPMGTFALFERLVKAVERIAAALEVPQMCELPQPETPSEPQPDNAQAHGRLG